MALPNGFRLAPGEFLVQCPYEKAHFITNTRLIVHLTKCRKNYLKHRQESGLSVEYVECKYNFYHKVLEPELEQHHATCPDQSNVVKFVQHRSRAPPCFGFKSGGLESQYKDEVKREGCKAEAGKSEGAEKPVEPEKDNVEFKEDTKNDGPKATEANKPNTDQKPRPKPHQQYRFNQPGQSIMDEKAYKYRLPEEMFRIVDHPFPGSAYEGPPEFNDFGGPIKQNQEEYEQAEPRNLKRSAVEDEAEKYPEDEEYFEEYYHEEAEPYNYDQDLKVDPEENWDTEDYLRAGAGESEGPRRGYDPSVKLQSQPVLYHPHGLTKSQRRKVIHCNAIKFHQRDFKPYRELDSSSAWESNSNVKQRSPSPVSSTQPLKKPKFEYER